MRIFYFCDINPNTNELQCYSHHTDTDQFGELPGYVDHIVGYSISQEGMFFKDKSGGILFTKVPTFISLEVVRFVIPPSGRRENDNAGLQHNLP